MRIKLIFSLFFLLVAIASWGQSKIDIDTTGLNEYHVSQYTSQQGLMQNSILDISFDSNGFIWLTTWKGISRFDGQQFKNFNPPNLVERNYYISNFITLSDRVLVLDRPHHYIKDGVLVYDTLYRGLDSVLPGNNNQHLTSRNYRFIPELKTKRAKNFFYINDSCAYSIANNEGSWEATHWLNGQISHVLPLSNYSTDSFTSLNFVKRSFVQNHALYYWGKDGFLRRFYKGVEVGRYEIPWKDEDEIYWTFGHHPFVYRRSTGALYQIVIRDSKVRLKGIVSGFNPTGSGITRVIDDPKNQSIWVGTGVQGLYRFKKKYFINHIAKNHPERNSSHSVIELGRDSLITTPGVLLMDRGERVKVLKQPLWQTFKGSNTKVWGLADPSKVIITKDSIYRKRFKWSPNKLSACAEDSSANIWCTGEDYLYHYQNDSFIKVSETRFGSSLLFYDKAKNQIWLCSIEQRKVYLHTPGSKDFKEIPELKGKILEQVFFSPSGIIFLKMSYERFYVYQDKKLIQLNGDPSGFLSYAHCVVEDKKGNLWFSSDYGLFRTTLASVKAYLKDQKNKIYYFHYDKSWGFDNNEFNSRGYPCGIITTKGTIAFPSLNGIVEFDPYKTPVQSYKGGMIVENIKLDGKRVRAEATSKLRPDFVDLEFQLIHPFFDNPNNIYLSYQLAGYSDEWYRVPKDGKIHFNQLYYGDYTLRVKKQSGFEDEDIVELNFPFTVGKFYYQTYWFFLLFVGVALIAIELVFKWRYSRNRKLRYALEVKVREKTNDYRKLNRSLQENVQKLEDLTESQEEIIRVRREMISIYAHDIRGPLHFIKLISEKAASRIKETSIDTIKEYLEIINESSSGILNQTEKMFTWNRAHDDDFPIAFKWISLKEVVVDEVKPLKNLADAKNTKMKYDIDTDILLHTEEDLLRIVINNLVQNSIKYTENGSICISSFEKDGVIQLKVKDTGLGMNSQQLAKVKAGVNGSLKGTKQETGKAFGLRMVRDILKRLNARMDISSQVGSGTTVCIEFVLSAEGNIDNSQEALLKKPEVRD